MSRQLEIRHARELKDLRERQTAERAYERTCRECGLTVLHRDAYVDAFSSDIEGEGRPVHRTCATVQ